MPETKTTAIATTDTPFDLALERYSLDEIGQIMHDMMGGEPIDAFSLPTLTVPGGGATVWRMPETDAEPYAEIVEGVVLSFGASRAYYAHEYGEGDDDPTPNCYSSDNIVGIGDPGGECASCKLNEWGSARSGGGKACKERRLVYILREGSILPLVVQVPAASLRPWRHYILSMMDHGGARCANTTRFGLTVARSGSRSYSQITFRRGRPLTTEQTLMAREYAAQLDTSMGAAAQT